MLGFLHGWNRDSSKAAVVDKNRAWLHAVEFLLHIEPNAKFVVCLRELGQIYGSIEAQHQRTILVDFIDHLADFDRFGRADMLFAKDKAVGSPLVSLYAVQDLPKAVKDRLFFLRFEDLIERPAAYMSDLYALLGLRSFEIDAQKLAPMGPRESDSHYRMKYPHTQSTHVSAPPIHEIPTRIAHDDSPAHSEVETSDGSCIRVLYVWIIGSSLLANLHCGRARGFICDEIKAMIVLVCAIIVTPCILIPCLFDKFPRWVVETHHPDSLKYMNRWFFGLSD
jgi:hypothetical protein